MLKLLQVRRERGIAAAVWSLFAGTWAELREVLGMRNLWRVVIFSLSIFFVAKQWVEYETILPAFLERTYGEDVPIYTIMSINLWGCMFLPPVVAALTGDRETFRVMLPGMLVMAASPVFLVISPTVSSAVAWISFLTIGEVFWSPRQTAWAMSLAPAGREGIFIAVSSLKDLVITWPSHLFIGWLNERFNPNCRDCRDDVGHFCSTALPNGTCTSTQALCLDIPPVPNATLLPAGCPSTCVDCPGYEGHPLALWGTILGFSLLSPVLVTLLLPFLRGHASFPCWCCFGTRLPRPSALSAR